VSAVIITRHRPEMLARAIDSLKSLAYPLAEVIVSDDSLNNNTIDMLTACYPEVKYVRGPQRGIAANRNSGIRVASSEYILMMDDDIIIHRDFLCLALHGGDTGKSSVYFAPMKDGEMSYSPKGISYLGFHTREYAPTELRQTLSSQAFVMPALVRDEVLFDESIVLYGYEEVDFGYRLCKKGYEIKLVRDCVNIHMDPNGKVTEKRHVHASRLYVTYKKIAIVDGRRFAALIYLCVAIPHLFLSMMRRRGFRGLLTAMSDLRVALSSIRSQSGKAARR
jgi:GT2 family glycosyltransferase